MTAEVVTLPSSARTATRIGQATAVEQARAVAEVQAAIVVAQQFPRDMRRVWEEMRDACSRMALANRAFYAVQNRGNGPSVHLARAIIRIYGNADYGVRELSRDDTAGNSEIQSFAWDQQSNVRSTRTFQVPHQRMKSGRRQDLTDLGDVYLNNQNVGARAVRECIASILPTDLWEEAQRICRETLEKGDGKPLVERINEMVAAFGRIGVTVAQMETRLDRKRREWTGADVAQMVVAYQSIQAGDAVKDEVFPAQRVTAAEIVGNATTPPPVAEPTGPAPAGGPPLLAPSQMRQMQAQFKDLGLVEPEEKREFAGMVLEIAVDSLKDLTEDQAAALIAEMASRIKAHES